MKNKKILDRLLENWMAKALSLAVAMLLFVFHRVNLLESKAFNTPLIIQGAENLIPEEELPEEVRITITGRKESITAFRENDISAYIDLTRINDKGSYRRPIKITRRGSALSLDIAGVSVTPVDIPLNLDIKAEKSIPVTVIINGNLPEGYDLISQTIEPSHVIVEGPASDLDRLDHVNTAPIDLTGRTDSFNVIERLVIGKNFIIKSGNTVQYRARISSVGLIRDYNYIKPDAINLSDDFDIAVIPDYVNVRMRGSQEALDSLNLPKVVFDCSGITEEGNYTLNAGIDELDIDGLTVDFVYPENIHVTFTKKAE